MNKKTNRKKKWKPRPFVKLMQPHYPIGHATGLTDKEWREFANSYKPKK